MKTILLGLYLLSVALPAICQEQKPEFDTTTYNITTDEKVRTDYLARYTQSLVSIQADGESGQGMIVGPNLVITSYSLVAGRSEVSYRDASGKTKYFDGYIAADPARGIVLLKTADVYTQFASLSYTSLSSHLPYWQSKVFFMHKDRNRYTVDRTDLVKMDESKEDPKVQAYVPRKVTYSGAKPLQGYIVFDASMIMSGIIVYMNGTPYHISNRPLLELSLYNDLAPNNLSDLPFYNTEAGNDKSKPAIYKIGLTSNKTGEKNAKIYDVLTLDYIKRDQQKMDLYFTFRSEGWSNGINFNPNLRLIDLKTGLVYRPSSSVNIPSYVYNNTSNRASIQFNNIPSGVNHIKLLNLPSDVYEYDSELRYKKTPSARKFFEDVIINNFPTTKKTQYSLEENAADEGAVAFYCLISSNMTEEVKISIDGDLAGTLTKYYTDPNTTDFCGRASSVTVRLKAGEYKYKAVMGKKSIERKFMVTKGKCSPQLIKF